MKLYYSPGACSLAPHIALCEAGLHHTLHKVDIPKKKYDGDHDFYAVNPKGYVPALAIDNGVVLTEGPAIVQYIADHAPDKHLAPKQGTFERYHLQEWLNFVSTELHKPIGSFFNPKLPEEMKTITMDRLKLRLGYLAGKLGPHHYLVGDHFTVADAYLFTILNWTSMVKIDLSPWPALGEFQKRIAARPHVQQALKAEGLIA